MDRLRERVIEITGSFGSAAAAAGDVSDLLERPLIALLATHRKKDTVMLSPVWFHEWPDQGFEPRGEATGAGEHFYADEV